MDVCATLHVDRKGEIMSQPTDGGHRENLPGIRAHRKGDPGELSHKGCPRASGVDDSWGRNPLVMHANRGHLATLDINADDLCTFNDTDAFLARPSGQPMRGVSRRA